MVHIPELPQIDEDRQNTDLDEDERLADYGAQAKNATRARRVTAGAILVLSIFLLIAAWDMDMGTAAQPGPGLMPRLAAAGLGLTAILALGSRVKPSADLETAPGRAGKMRQALIFGTLALYVLTLPVLGFLISSSAALSVCSWRINPQGNVKRAVIVGCLVAISIDAFFRHLLGVNLPSGIWDIATG